MRKIGQFALFNSILPFADISTDSLTFVQLLYDGHYYWAAATFAVMWNPFILHLIIFCYGYIQSLRACNEFNTSQRMKEVGIHVPLILPFKNLHSTYLLFQMGFGMPRFKTKNWKKVEEIQTEAGLASMYESFMEAGPQSIIQLIIVLSTGKINTAQLFSIPLSIFTITWASSRAYFIQRGRDETDPDPELKTVFLRVFPWMLLIVINSIILWTTIAGLLGKYIFIGFFIGFTAAYLSIYALDAGGKTKQRKDKLKGVNESVVVMPDETHSFLLLKSSEDIETKSRGGDKQLAETSRLHEETSKCVELSPVADAESPIGKENSYFRMKASLTSIWLPCVVGSKRNTFITSAIVSLTNKILVLILAAILSHFDLILVNQFLIWCEDQAKFELRENGTMKSCTNITSCLDQSDSLQQKIRICGDSEDFIQLILFTIIGLTTFLSIVASYRLHKNINYIKLYETTKSFCCIKTEQVVHRSLVFSLAIDEDKHEKLEEVLKSQTTNQMLNRTRRGETALHLASMSGAEKCIHVLLMQGGVLKENENGTIPEIADALSHLSSCEVVNKLQELKMAGELENSVISKLFIQKTKTGETLIEASRKFPLHINALLKLATKEVDKVLQVVVIPQAASILTEMDMVMMFQEMKKQGEITDSTITAMMTEKIKDNETPMEAVRTNPDVLRALVKLAVNDEKRLPMKLVPLIERMLVIEEVAQVFEDLKSQGEIVKRTMLSQCMGKWVWSTCTITVSTSGDDNCGIKAVGDLGWSIGVMYFQEEDGSLVVLEMEMLGQPLQIPHIAEDENMNTIHRLLVNLYRLSLEGSGLKLSSQSEDLVIDFERKSKDLTQPHTDGVFSFESLRALKEWVGIRT